MPIAWETSFDAALARGREQGRLVMAEFHSPHWIACQELDKATFPVEAVAKEVEEHVVPARVNVLTERDLTKRMRVPWTPTFLFVDADGLEHHRFIGYLPPDEFAAQVHLAGARAAFNRGAWEEASGRYARIAEKFPMTDAAPESVYWIGVCDFKRTKNIERIYEQCRETARRYPNHIWGKKLNFVK